MTLLTVTEAARHLKKSPKSIYSWIHDKVDPLPCFKDGRYKINLDELERYYAKYFQYWGTKEV